MNPQLVNSLVEVVLSLSSEDRQLFQEKLLERQREMGRSLTGTSLEKAERFRQWLARFPKSSIPVAEAALHRENMYDDRGRW
jgi:hypothetical protein